MPAGDYRKRSISRHLWCFPGQYESTWAKNGWSMSRETDIPAVARAELVIRAVRHSPAPEISEIARTSGKVSGEPPVPGQGEVEP